MKSNHPNVLICPKEDKHNVFKAPNPEIAKNAEKLRKDLHHPEHLYIL